MDDDGMPASGGAVMGGWYGLRRPPVHPPDASTAPASSSAIHRRPATDRAYYNGNIPSRAWYSWPSSSVSEPTTRPAGVDRNACTPTPRDRVGFHASALPVTGSIAPIPGRHAAPGPADLFPSGLSSQISCPPT